MTIHRPRKVVSDDEGSDGSDVGGGSVPAAADSAACDDAGLLAHSCSAILCRGVCDC